jgi:outer membrane lipoprotein-sorting protein
MRAYRFGIVALAFTCLTTLPPTAQQAEPQTAQQVFSRMAQVMGLEKAAKVRTVQMASTVEYTLQGLRGRIEVFIKSPNKMLVKTTIEGVGEFVSAYNGKVGWEKDPRSGVREARGERLTQMRESAREGAGNDVRKLIRNATLVGNETIDGREAFVIEGTTALGVWDTCAWGRLFDRASADCAASPPTKRAAGIRPHGAGDGAGKRREDTHRADDGHD